MLLLLPPPVSEDGSAGNRHSSPAGRFRPPGKDSSEARGSGAAAVPGGNRPHFWEPEMTAFHALVALGSLCMEQLMRYFSASHPLD